MPFYNKYIYIYIYIYSNFCSTNYKLCLQLSFETKDRITSTIINVCMFRA